MSAIDDLRARLTEGYELTAEDVILIIDNLGGGGHVIIDEFGNPMPQRENLQFTGVVGVTDDLANDTTVVNIDDDELNFYGIYMLNNLGGII